MCTGTITPTISVDIGGQLRIYHAFVTTARPAMDGPSTLTLYTSNFSDVAGFAADSDPVQRRVRSKGRPHRARQRHGARMASGDVPKSALPLRARRCAAPRSAGAAAVAVAAPLHAADDRGHGHDAEPGRLDRQSPRVQPPAFRGLNREVASCTRTSRSFPTTRQCSRRQARRCGLHFAGGELDGLKLIGFAVWSRRDGGGKNVTFPARQFTVHGERRHYSLLRPVEDVQAEKRLKEVLLQAYLAHEAGSAEGATAVADCLDGPGETPGFPRGGVSWNRSTWRPASGLAHEQKEADAAAIHRDRPSTLSAPALRALVGGYGTRRFS